MKKLILIIITLITVALPSFSVERVALVIGNNAYQHAPVLANAVNDARAVAAKLKESQFSVLLVEDATAEKLHESLEKFQEMARGCSVGLIYYSGHGMEDEGKNYLLPVDATIERKAQIPLQTLSLAQILEAMKNAQIPAKIVLLDSCRNMPLSRSWRTTRSLGGGMAELKPSDMPEATLVYYATAPGQEALDAGSEGKHSPFTQGILATMSKPGIHALEAMMQVEDSVQEQTQGKQRPKLFSDGETGPFRKFSFVSPGAPSAGTVTPEPAKELPPTSRSAVEAKDAFTRYRKGAEMNDPDAMNSLGECYLTGDGVAKNVEDAAKWYRKAAELNQPQAMTKLGKCYNFGVGLPKNLDEAVRWYRKAADFNYPEAMTRLGILFQSGNGIPKDGIEAVKWFRKAADLNDPTAMHALGLSYKDGDGVPKDLDEAAKWYRKAADLNRPEAMWALGDCYGTGNGVPKDDNEAVNWYRKAADLNEPNSMFTLAGCYFRGYGVPKDQQESLKWLRKAADLNLPVAMFELGECYVNCKGGVPKDIDEGVKWWRKAADLHHPNAMTKLGMCYSTGTGVPKNLDEGAKWFRKAADLNEPHAMSNLGVCYSAGSGVPKDFDEAAKWYRKAADSMNLDPSGLKFLADYYSQNDKNKDAKQAAYWRKKADEAVKK